MPKTCSCGEFSRLRRWKASAFLPSQTQKFIRNSCVFGASQFKIVIFLLKQGTKSTAYCRMPRFARADEGAGVQWTPLSEA